MIHIKFLRLKPLDLLLSFEISVVLGPVGEDSYCHSDWRSFCCRFGILDILDVL